MNQVWAYKLGIPLARYLPAKLVYWAGLRLADISHRRDHKGREAVIKNTLHIFQHRGITPSTEVLQGFSRKTYQYFGKNLVDFFRYSHLTQEELKAKVSTRNIEALKNCYEEGKGVIALTAHYGNWEMGGGVVASLGYPMNAVALPQRLARLDSLFQAQREKHGMRVIPLGRSAVGLMHCLRRGEVVALLADRDFTRRGIYVDFFGAKARMPVGPSWLSKKTGAPIVPIFLSRLIDDTFMLRVLDPIRPEDSDSIPALQQRIAEALEKEIGEHPYQWFIFDDYWKSGGSECDRE